MPYRVKSDINMGQFKTGDILPSKFFDESVLLELEKNNIIEKIIELENNKIKKEKKIK